MVSKSIGGPAALAGLIGLMACRVGWAGPAAPPPGRGVAAMPAAASGQLDDATYYTLQELQAVEAEGQATGLSINDWGQVAGYLYAGGVTKGFVTDPKVRGVHLFAPELANYINVVASSGAMGGYSCDAANQCSAFALSPRHPQDPAWISIDGANQTYGVGINASGQVAGYYRTDVARAFITGPRGQGITLIDAGTASQAIAVNDAGQLLGTYQVAPTWHVFVRDPDGTMHLVNVGNHPAWNLNASGQVVGQGPFITGSDGQDVRFLSLIDGTTGAALLSINARGQAVGVEGGYDENNQYFERAIVTDLRGTHLYRLESLVQDMPPGVHLREARSINDHGQIVANGDSNQVYLLTPKRVAAR